MPVITGAPSTKAYVGATYQFVPTASDADGDLLTFQIDNRPGWATFSPTTGRLSGSPPASAESRTYANIVISVSDSKATVALPQFDLTVESAGGVPPANTAPTISGTPPVAATVGNAYSFAPHASDADGQALQFSIANQPGWTQFDASTGRLSGTPGAADVGTVADIVITVSDGTASASLPAFDLVVSAGEPPPAVNRAPTISGTPASAVTAGGSYVFQPSATDPDGQALNFTIAGKPSWASFNGSTGRLAGTPSAANVGQYSGIVITVSDGSASAALAAFAVTVLAANRAPLISGTPPTSATVGQPYTFQPTASDPDGDALTYTIVNKPQWATFSASSGRLSGTPLSANVGDWPAIRISVSDGAATASLAQFTITVAASPTGSATLSWAAPTQNEDGSTLTDLKGFRIYYGQSASSLATMLEIPTPTITTATVEDLAPATWYFGVKAYTTSGVESDLSNVASKVIN